MSIFSVPLYNEDLTDERENPTPLNKSSTQTPDETSEAQYEKSNKNESETTELVSLFDPSIRDVHINVMKQYFTMSFILVTFVMGILSVYWGSLYKRSHRIHNLNVWVIDFDESTVGNSVVDALQPYFGVSTTLGFETIKASDYHGNISTVAGDVHEERVWAAIAIAPNASDVLNQASQSLEAVDTSYLVQFIFNPGRADAATFNYMLPIMNNFSAEWSREFANQWVRNLSSTLSESDMAKLATNAPAMIARPITFTMRQVTVYKGDVAPAILVTGLIYLIIVSFNQVLHFASVNLMLFGKVRFFQTMVHRQVVNGIAIFILSLGFSLVSLAFGQDFSIKYGKAGGFVIYWMINFMAMMALGGATENILGVITTVFMPGAGYWVLFWIALNSATSFSPLELSPGVFKIGLALPVHNAQQAVRTVIFDTKSNMGINFAVFTVWIVVNFCVSFLIVRFIRWWRTREAIKAAKKNAAASA